MENTKVYYTDEGTYTFDIEFEEMVQVPVWWAKCRENGKMAWLDREGIQFEGEKRFKASTEPVCTGKSYVTYECDPLYPEDSITITKFHDTLEEARLYAQRVMESCDIPVRIYEIKEVQ